MCSRVLLRSPSVSGPSQKKLKQVHFLIQHSIQLIGQVIKHVPNVIQNVPCRLHNVRSAKREATECLIRSDKLATIQENLCIHSFKCESWWKVSLTPRCCSQELVFSPQPSVLPPGMSWSSPASDASVLTLDHLPAEPGAFLKSHFDPYSLRRGSTALEIEVLQRQHSVQH